MGCIVDMSPQEPQPHLMTVRSIWLINTKHSHLMSTLVALLMLLSKKAKMNK